MDGWAGERRAAAGRLGAATRRPQWPTVAMVACRSHHHSIGHSYAALRDVHLCASAWTCLRVCACDLTVVAARGGAAAGVDGLCVGGRIDVSARHDRSSGEFGRELGGECARPRDGIVAVGHGAAEIGGEWRTEKTNTTNKKAKGQTIDPKGKRWVEPTGWQMRSKCIHS